MYSYEIIFLELCTVQYDGVLIKVVAIHGIALLRIMIRFKGINDKTEPGPLTN